MQLSFHLQRWPLIRNKMMAILIKTSNQDVSIEIKSLSNSKGDNNVSFRPLANYDKDKNVTVNQLTFPEFHFETEAKVDFPSACI